MAEIIGMILHVVNIILLLVLVYIYLQNYKQLKTRFTAGLLLFSTFFLIQSVMNLYFDITMVMYASKSAEMAAILVEGIKAVGFAILVWISWE